jgi:hypothetical protein
MRLLPEPLDPTKESPIDVRLELVPVTVIELLDPALPLIINLPPANAVPPLEITRLFEEPSTPTTIVSELLHADPVPETLTRLLEAVASLPMTLLELVTIPPLAIRSALVEPASPTVRSPWAVQDEFMPVTTT